MVACSCSPTCVGPTLRVVRAKGGDDLAGTFAAMQLAIARPSHYGLCMHVPIEPNLLVKLAMLLRTKSVSAAAEALGVSQPSVSRALARLRDELKDPLLVRHGNSMVLTPRSEELLDRLDRWLVHTADVIHQQSFDPGTLERRFQIGSTDFGVLSVLRPALAEIREEAPGVSVQIVPLDWSAHSTLAEGAVDLVISGLDSDPAQLHRHLLFTDRFACMMKPEHPLSGGADEPLTLDEYLACPHLGMTVSDARFDRINQLLGCHSSRRKLALVAPYFSLAPELVEGDMLLTLPERAARHYGAIHGNPYRLAPQELGTMEYWLLWHERSHRDPASQWLRERLVEACVAAE